MREIIFTGLFLSVVALVLADNAPSPAATAPTIERDYQCRADLEAFREWSYRNGDKPSEAAVQRVLAQAQADPKNPELLLWAGVAEQNGLIPKGQIDGLASYRRAAELGYVPAMARWAAELCTGERVPRDVEAGIKLLRQAADRGDARALYTLGALYATGLSGFPKDLQRAEQCLTQALDKGFFPAARNLTAVCELRKDTRQILKYGDLASQLGDRDCMLPLAKYYASRDPEKAVQYLLRGALWGDPALMREYALAPFREQLKLPRDEYMMLHLLRSAARQGDSVAEVWLARYQVQGSQPERGRSTLERLLKTAKGEAGTEAEWTLGQLLCEDEHLVKDLVRGRSLIQQAADHGHPLARQWLAKHPDRGPADVEQSGRNAYGPSTQPATQDEQMLSDLGEFEDWHYRMADPPTPGAVQRVVALARGQSPSPRVLMWAAIATDSGWAREVSRETANGWLRLAAEKQDAAAMAAYGNALLSGNGGLPRDFPAGLNLIEQAADRGESSAYLHLGQVYMAGAPGGVPRDLDRAEQLLQQALGRGMLRSLRVLSKLYILRGDAVRAAEYLRKAASVGDTDAMREIAEQLLANMKTVPNADRHLKELATRGALWGDPRLIHILAICSQGDPHLERLLLRRAAAMGDPDAMASVALCHVNGEAGFERDPLRGVADLEQLAKDPSNCTARYALGQLLCEGAFVERDEARGRALIEQAAASGHIGAKDWLAKHAKDAGK